MVVVVLPTPPLMLYTAIVFILVLWGENAFAKDNNNFMTLLILTNFHCFTSLTAAAILAPAPIQAHHFLALQCLFVLCKMVAIVQ